MDAVLPLNLSRFELQLIVETPSLLLLCDFERKAIMAVTNFSFSIKFIVESISEEAGFDWITFWTFELIVPSAFVDFDSDGEAETKLDKAEEASKAN